jgi:hypothetical protein
MGVETTLFSASASDSSWGFGVQAYVSVNRLTFTKTDTNTYALNYYASFVSGYSGSSTSSRVAYIKLQIYANDTTTPIKEISASYGVGSPDVRTIDSVNYPPTLSQTITTTGSPIIRVYAQCTGSANSGTISVTATIDQTFYIYMLDNNTSYNKESIFITNTTDTNKMFILPDSSTVEGSLYYFKNLTSNYMYITTLTTQNIDESNYNIVKISDKYDASILANKDSTKWYICTFYNGNMQRRNKSPGVTAKNASAGVNIFDAGTTAVDSGCILPDPTANSGKMCIVVYSGQVSYNGGLLFTSSVNTIDNDFSNNSDNKVYLYADNDYKSTGVIFVSNGTYWCIMGWYDTYGINFNNEALTPTVTLTDNAESTGQINVRPSESGTATIKLPAYNSSYNSDGSQFLVLKTGNKTGGFPDWFTTNGTDKFSTSSAARNNCKNEIRRNAYACTIIVSRKNPSSNFLEYFPVSNY